MLRRILLASAGAMALSGAALAADLPSRAPPPAFLPPPVFTWSGIYIGATAGFDQATHNTEDLDFFFNGATTQLKTQGFIGGGTLGINFQQGNFVYGIETDFSGLTNKQSITENPMFDDPEFFSNRINYLGTVRGRLGLAVDRAMFYFTAGLAYGGVHNTFGDTCGVVDGCEGDEFSVSSGTTRVGWTVGGGIEYALTPNWSIKGEALYADLGTTSATLFVPTNAPGFQNFQVRFDNTVVIIRGGVNYKFDFWGPGPVVAKY